MKYLGIFLIKKRIFGEKGTGTLSKTKKRNREVNLSQLLYRLRISIDSKTILIMRSFIRWIFFENENLNLFIKNNENNEN
jgi:hypothetical protein